MSNVLKGVIAVVGLLSATGTYAALTPVGVQNDVLYSDVVGSWGWNVVSVSNYGDSTAISALFNGLSASDKVMIGAMHAGSNTIDVLAAATLADITQYTGLNVTHVANGVEWYFNGYSMGFAGLGDVINQTSADTNGLNERDRLSWHTTMTANTFNQNSSLSPLYVYNGWRSGSNYNIYQGTDWQRVVFTTAVPEADTYAMMLAGLGLVGFMARRRAQAAV